MGRWWRKKLLKFTTCNITLVWSILGYLYTVLFYVSRIVHKTMCILCFVLFSNIVLLYRENWTVNHKSSPKRWQCISQIISFSLHKEFSSQYEGKSKSNKRKIKKKEEKEERLTIEGKPFSLLIFALFILFFFCIYSCKLNVR